MPQTEPETIELAGAEPALSDSPRHRLPRMPLTRNLRRPTEYVRQLNGEFSDWAYNEERAAELLGRWRSEVFKVEADMPIDVEIGTGNGYHFAHLAEINPSRRLVGIELKFKPLIQSIRRALRTGASNARIIRYDASRVVDVFAPGEIDNVYIHHPDPWLKKRQWKHRLIQDEFLADLHTLMRPGSFVDFKTDSADYFAWALDKFKASRFHLSRETWDLHGSEWQAENFVTQFEKIFLAQGQSIHYARLLRQS
jgi:tRNA (guanine-N7-)-methyltransferase